MSDDDRPSGPPLQVVPYKVAGTVEVRSGKLVKVVVLTLPAATVRVTPACAVRMARHLLESAAAADADLVLLEVLRERGIAVVAADDLMRAIREARAGET